MSKSKKSLDLSNQNIIGILDLEKYPKLEYLNCSHNQITQIINISQYIKYIDCSHNLIENLDYQISNPMYLDYLNCSHNPIHTLFYPFDVKPKSYPKTLKNIEYSGYFNEPIDNLPEGLETLTFFCCEYIDSHFNQPVDNLPNSIVKIHFGNYFNQPVDNLPESLINLFFEKHGQFNHTIDNLPSGLKTLYLGYHFNQPVNNLPLGLEVLCMGYCIFNHPINNLPDTINELILGEKFNQHIEKVPSSIKSIMLAGENYGFKKQLYQLSKLKKFHFGIDISLY
jgi:Leucine-rich repeat (LRR) protein